MILPKADRNVETRETGLHGAGRFPEQAILDSFEDQGVKNPIQANIAPGQQEDSGPQLPRQPAILPLMRPNALGLPNPHHQPSQLPNPQFPTQTFYDLSQEPIGIIISLHRMQQKINNRTLARDCARIFYPYQQLDVNLLIGNHVKNNYQKEHLLSQMPPDQILKDLVDNDVRMQTLEEDGLDWCDEFGEWLRKPRSESALKKYDLKSKDGHVMKVMRLERFSFDPEKDCSKQDWYGGRANNADGDRQQGKEAAGFSMDVGMRPS